MIKEYKQQNIPKHIGIVMGGNRCWANERNLNPVQGCESGFEKIFKAPQWFFDQGVDIVSILAFPASDWGRDPGEVSSIMKVFKKIILKNEEKIYKKKWRFLFSGKISELPGDLPDICYKLENKTKLNIQGILNIYLNYDGRLEILEAVRKMINNKIEIEQVHEGLLRKYLYNAGLEDPTGIIITGGKRKLNGFQLWQSANSKLFLLEKDWPDFEEADAVKIVNELLEG